MSPSIVDSTPHAVAATLVLGGVLVASSYIYFASASSKSSTSTGTSMPGWVQQMIDLFSSPSNKKRNSRMTVSAAMVAQRRGNAEVPLSREELLAQAYANCDSMQKAEYALEEQGRRIDNTEEAISDLQACQADHSRKLDIFGDMINLHQHKHEESDRLHDASNKRHNSTEGKVKELQKVVKRLNVDKENFAKSILVMVFLFAFVVFTKY